MPTPDQAASPIGTTLGNPIISVRPVVLPSPERGDNLQVRVTAPTAGTGLPVIVLAHGFGLAMDSYDPLVDFWAANGFVVVQPTFLDSLTLGLTPADPRYPTIWRSRVDDLERVIDHLDTVLAALPGLPDRVDGDRLAVAGHSWGGQSVSMLLGARVIGPDGQPGDDASDPRVKAGVLLATTGTGGDDLTPFAQENFSFMSPDFDQLASPTLVVAGDRDQSPLSTRGPDWFTDVYRLSPGAQSLVTVFGGEHSLGGIQAYKATDTTDENPERVDLVRRATTAFLLKALGIDSAPWDRETAALAAAPAPVGRIDSQ
ncbi:MAG: alpha/beta hydrolase family protein [Janthinobacterium lividum]